MLFNALDFLAATRFSNLACYLKWLQGMLLYLMSKQYIP